MSDRLLSVCELAKALGRAESYVWAMRRKGFVMIGGRATLSAALDFLAGCPHPRKEEASHELACEAAES
jgi:hypothetical protein